MLKLIFLSFLVFMLCGTANAQILFPESFTLILDPDRRVKGSITPRVKFLTQRRNLIAVDNTADLSIRLKKNALSFANQIEFQKFGDEAIQSGGFVYGEYRNLSGKWSFPNYMRRFIGLKPGGWTEGMPQGCMAVLSFEERKS